MAHIFDLHVRPSQDPYSEHDDYSDHMCDSMETAMDLAEGEYGDIEWSTPVNSHRGTFQTGTFTDPGGEYREVIISRRKVKTAKDARKVFDPSRTRTWEVHTSAYRSPLGTMTRSPYLGDTPYLFSVSCGVKGCDYTNSSKAWNEVKAQRALSDHHHAKHGLAKEHY